jgi:hypothetical protein
MPPKQQKQKINIENMPNKKEKMTDTDPISFVHFPIKFGTKYLILPTDTEKKRKEKKTVSELTKFWDIDQITDVIEDNFEFSMTKKYNIYALTSDGWRDIGGRTRRGDSIQHHVTSTLLDSMQNEVDNPYAHIFAIDITEF